VEAVPLESSSSSNILKFLEDNNITKYGVPNKITMDNASVFKSIEMISFFSGYSITSAHSANYYPQGNGLAESNNKNLIRIIRKTVGNNKRVWDSYLKYALWADRITKKHATGKGPFELVYGLDVVLPVNFRLPV
jgi:transposase InsO family protein